MSEKTKAFMDRAKTQTIGCEIEMAEITRNMAIKTVARYFGTLDTVHHDGGAYDAWSCKDTQGRRHAGQSLEGNARRKHFGKQRY